MVCSPLNASQVTHLEAYAGDSFLAKWAILEGIGVEHIPVAVIITLPLVFVAHLQQQVGSQCLVAAVALLNIQLVCLHKAAALAAGMREEAAQKWIKICCAGALPA